MAAFVQILSRARVVSSLWTKIKFITGQNVHYCAIKFISTLNIRIHRGRHIIACENL